jgi:hypothetical protein
MKYLLLVSTAFLPTASAVVLSIGEGSFISFSGRDGSPLPDGSTIQIGYFLGIADSILPSAFTPQQWSTFTPILGLGSPNSDSRNPATDFGTGEFDFAGLTVDTEADSGLPSFPTRLGIRVFDTTETPDPTTFFNTLSSDSRDWILELPTGTPPIPGTGRADLLIDDNTQSAITFEDNTNRFMTIVQIPEPSSALSLLLGTLLMTGRRRRS